MPEPQRHDPVSRPVDGAINNHVANWILPNGMPHDTDPNWVYCEANPNDEATGVPHMRANGWEIVPVHDDAPRLAGGEASRDGVSVLVRFGQVLMRRPRAVHEAYREAVARTALVHAQSIGSEKYAADGLRYADQSDHRYQEHRRS